MEKPKEILELEKLWNVEFNELGNNIFWRQFFVAPVFNDKRNYYTINKNYEVEGIISNWSEITEITFLSNFKALVCLNLNCNKITDIRPLSNLDLLRCLSLIQNNILDYNPISNLNSLNVLILKNSNVSNGNFLSNFKSLHFLDLGWNRITDISFLSNLKSITQLHLENIRVSDFDVISSLSSLRQLDLGGNKIANIPFLSNLTFLSYLNLSTNYISDISYLSNLKHLSNLNLSTNKITNISVLSNLTLLTILTLSKNSIADYNVLSSCSLLQYLNLCFNQINDINFILNLKSLDTLILQHCNISSLKQLEYLSNLPNLTFINIKDNPLPIESGIELDNLESLRAYFKDREKGLTKHRHLKLLFLGDGCVGKSTLFSHLRDGKVTEIEINDRTDGIALTCWENVLPEVTVNVWDFGGQDIFHGTHRLFLGERAIYVLVYTKDIHKKCSKEEKHPLRYWLDFIVDYGRKSFVFLVENIMNEDYSTNEEFPDDLTFLELSKEYEAKNILIDRTQYRFDCKNDSAAIKKFRRTLESEIENILERNKIDGHPKNWHEVQTELEEKKKTKLTLGMTEFEVICKEHDIADAKVLLNYFHKSGTVSHYPNLYQDTIILQTHWVLDAIYAVISIKETSLLKNKNGKLVNEDFDLIWQQYNEADRKLFISYLLKSGLMAEPFKYSWENKLERTYQYLFPALFQKVKPHDKIFWNEKEACYGIEFRFVYQAIMQRLQVTILNHCHPEEEEIFYRNYIKFTDNQNWIGFIEMDETNKELKIWAENEALYAKIFKELHNIYPLDRVKIFQHQKGKSSVLIPYTPDKIGNIILKEGFDKINTVMPTLNYNKDGNYWNLVKEFKAKKVVLFAGTGVSAYTTVSVKNPKGNPLSMWKGLLLHGIDYCLSVGACDERWANRKREDLSDGNVEDWLSVAEGITTRLKEKAHFNTWLNKSVGSLKIEKPALIEEIKELNCPVFTTNYDNLLEEGLGRKPIHNLQPDKIQELLNNVREGVIYLHGYYDDSETVILGIRSYEQLANKAFFQALQQAIILTKHILFVGYGAGLDDPNFGKLIEWSKQNITSEHHHYRLVLEKDKNIDSGDNKIQNIVYGTHYDDIVTFFQELNKDVSTP